MIENRIADLHTESWEDRDGERRCAMMVAINVDDPDDVERFVGYLVIRVRTLRMLSPPETSMMLVTIIGDLTAEDFAKIWRRFVQSDEVMSVFMSRMKVADVVHGTPAGEVLDRCSLLAPAVMA